MEKRAGSTLTAVVVAGVVALAAVTRHAGRTRRRIGMRRRRHAPITVNATAIGRTAPDEAVIGLGVTSEGEDGAAALDAERAEHEGGRWTH